MLRKDEIIELEDFEEEVFILVNGEYIKVDPKDGEEDVDDIQQR